MKRFSTFNSNEIALTFLIPFLIASLSLTTICQEVNNLNTTFKKVYIPRANLQFVSFEKKNCTFLTENFYLVGKETAKALPSESSSVITISKPNKQPVLKMIGFSSAQKKQGNQFERRMI
jgi:hypothetical protein